MEDWRVSKDAMGDGDQGGLRERRNFRRKFGRWYNASLALALYRIRFSGHKF